MHKQNTVVTLTKDPNNTFDETSKQSMWKIFFSFLFTEQANHNDNNKKEHCQ